MHGTETSHRSLRKLDWNVRKSITEMQFQMKRIHNVLEERSRFGSYPETGTISCGPGLGVPMETISKRRSGKRRTRFWANRRQTGSNPVISGLPVTRAEP